MAAEYKWGMYSDDFEIPVDVENESEIRNDSTVCSCGWERLPSIGELPRSG